MSFDARLQGKMTSSKISHNERNGSFQRNEFVIYVLCFNALGIYQKYETRSKKYLELKTMWEKWKCNVPKALGKPSALLVILTIKCTNASSWSLNLRQLP